MRFRALIFAVLWILSAAMVRAGSPVVIRVAAPVDSEPKFVLQGTAVAGSCIDIFRAIERLDPGLKFVGDRQWMPLKRIEALIAGRKLEADGVVLVNAGSGAIAALKTAGNLKLDSTANTSAQNIDKLLADRGRFFYYRIPGLDAEIRKGGHGRQVRLLPAVFDTQVFYMVLGRHLDQETEGRIALALSRLDEHGDLKQIAEKWSAY
ncbi:hypothetical protein [Duganella sp. Root336D2]|uniref:hypothetical protein n=1 Tax=Duganella sp. Root336D2 TaxID=1736518 RepID=UPI0007013F9E|nr:hypothetical protein [Duganella sp. Root336D2]KQV53745.1 hypothetical protein ASD07_04100 [Duganella sp. Root336D2]